MMNKNKFKKIAAIVCSAALTGALAFSLTACNNNDNDKNDGNDTNTTQGSVLLNKSTASVKVGETVTINVTSSPSGTITWSSSDTSVATVTADASNSKLATVSGLKVGTATITAKDGDLTATCTVTVTAAQNNDDDDDDNNDNANVYDLEFATKETINETESMNDTWYYWSESWVEISQKKYNNGTLNITFDNNKCDNAAEFWMTQLFYKKTGLETGRYHISMTINSTAAGHVQICGQAVELKSGSNNVDVYYNDAGGVNFEMQFAANGYPHDLQSATLAITVNSWEKDTAQEKLGTPSFTYDSGTKVITITPATGAVGVGKYQLKLYQDNVLKNSVDVVSGEAVDFSTVAPGEYVAKLVAVPGNIHYLESDPSSESVTVNVANEKTEVPYGSQNGGVAENDSINNPDNWRYWSNKGYEGGATPTVTDHYLDSTGKFHITFADSGILTWDMQAFYKNSQLTAGTKYTLTISVHSSVVGTITINGKDIDLQTGDNDNLTVDYTEIANNASISIQFNTIPSGTFVISGWSWALAPAGDTAE